MSKFTHLHVHSHYSLLDGLPKIDELLDYVQSLGMDSIALTDHGAIYGAVEFYKKAVQRGIKPILGAELYLAYENRFQKRPNIDDKRYHLTLLAKNETGYKNLVKLITKAHLEGFYYKPRIDEELLEKHSDGLILLSGCLRGKIPRLILAKKLDEVEVLAKKYQDIFGKDNFYFELQDHPNIPEQKTINKALVSLSQKLKIPFVATHDTHYLRKDDAQAQDILMLINTGADPNDPERITMKADDFSLKTPEEMKRAFKDLPEAIENTQKIAESCNFQFEFGKTKLPSFEVPNGKSPDEYLRELCYQGLEKKKIKIDEKIEGRLNNELSVISKTKFATYFLIVQDFVNWAKENRIVVGPGRGSVGGSLVAYLTGITYVDPLKYNLLFERFLTPDRVSPPDIDLDFTDRRRDEVINYVAQKYGRDRVSQIITFGTMAARAVIRDVGRALSYAYSYCDQVAKLIPFGMSLDETLKKVAEFRQLYDTDLKAKKLIDFAKKLEGVARHVSTHACGVVISNEPLDEITPLQHPTQDDTTIVTQYGMHSLEDLGLLKLDLLGLKNLTIIEDTLARIYKVRNEKIEIANLPSEDKETFRLLEKGETVGVFQLESGGMQRYLKELKPSNLEDIIAMVALYRPGPMRFIPDYIAGKHKRKRVEYLHPKLKPILESTYGVCIYQEQLMQTAQQLAGFSLFEADILRKAIGKKIKQLLNDQEERLVAGMIKNDIPKETARKIWEWILPFASYGFNKSHSAAYAIIAYQTAYLKAHYPVEFMAALLTADQNDVERIGFLIGECKKMGTEVLNPDINESWRNFTVIPGKKQIRFGLLAIKNVGHNVVDAIVKERENAGLYQSIFDFVSRLNPRDLNKKSLESLIKAGCFDKLEERGKLLSNVERLLEQSRANNKNFNNGQRDLFGGGNVKLNSYLALTETVPVSKMEKLKWEKELLGLYVTAHPLDDFKGIFAKKIWPISKISSDLSQRIIKTGGIISKVKKIITKSGRPMLFLSLEDLTDKIEVIAFPGVLEKNLACFQENKIVLISGRVDSREGIPKIVCEEIEEIIEA